MVWECPKDRVEKENVGHGKTSLTIFLLECALCP